MSKLVLLLFCLGFNSQASEFIYSLTATEPTINSNSCQKSCLINSDCGLGAYCNQGSCKYSSYFCMNERWSVNDRGETENCDAYLCDNKTGLCKTTATLSADCTFGYIFDGQKSCVSSLNCNPLDKDCNKITDQWNQARQNYEKQTPEPMIKPFDCQTCAQHGDCAADEMCWNKRCVAQNKYCGTNETGEEVSMTKTGPQSTCGLYKCDKVTGNCLEKCSTDKNCRTGSICRNNLCLTP